MGSRNSLTARINHDITLQEVVMQKKNPEDRNREKIVLFVTEAQKGKLLKWCEKHSTNMSEWGREKIEELK